MPNHLRPHRSIDRRYILVNEEKDMIVGWVIVRDANVAKRRLKPREGEAIYIRLAEPEEYYE